MPRSPIGTCCSSTARGPSSQAWPRSTARTSSRCCRSSTPAASLPPTATLGSPRGPPCILTRTAQFSPWRSASARPSSSPFTAMTSTRPQRQFSLDGSRHEPAAATLGTSPGIQLRCGNYSVFCTEQAPGGTPNTCGPEADARRPPGAAAAISILAGFVEGARRASHAACRHPSGSRARSQQAELLCRMHHSRVDAALWPLRARALACPRSNYDYRAKTHSRFGSRAALQLSTGSRICS
mmetsp:Transcript_26875/g.76251  ORF Transcript_26875/g.76251 Transcript_26875/m.76251 type:complete len:239 (-) Transcript_26875:22-738(-)